MEKTRHAYMIIAHHNFDQLCKLIGLLDDAANDIYIHIDKKAEKIPFDRIRSAAKESEVVFTDRISVSWGGYSIIKAELILLKEALKKRYSYLHLLSGEDLPIKTQREIHSFFEENDGKEFLGFDKVANETRNFIPRIRYYYPFQEAAGRKGTVFAKALRVTQKMLVKLQAALKIDRLGGEEEKYCKGGTWFSITEGFAKYVVEREEQIKRQYRNTFGSDEIFLQSLVMTSPFKDRVHVGSMRLIDWNRGGPYVFTIDDYEEIMGSDCLFARKFDERADSMIIDKIYESLL